MVIVSFMEDFPCHFAVPSGTVWRNATPSSPFLVLPILARLMTHLAVDKVFTDSCKVCIKMI